MKNLKYLEVGCSWPSVMDLGYDEVVKLLIDGQRYRALKADQHFTTLIDQDAQELDDRADRLIAKQAK